jgi:hypothetical protein
VDGETVDGERVDRERVDRERVDRELNADERAELERLRRAEWASRRRWARAGRWVAATALLLVAALLGGLAVVAVYLRDQVLDTDTYVATVTPLAQDPAVRSAVAQRLTDEIITRSDLSGLAMSAAGKLEQSGAPEQVSDLVAPLVSGVSSFLNDKINSFMTTARFETAWVNINRVAHEGLVTVLTGRQGRFLTSEGDTVTLDLGELLTLVKERLVAEGMTIFGRIPDVSVPYTLVQSDRLPLVRTYARLLDAAGTWLPWVALVALLGGVLVAPGRRRAILVGSALAGGVAVALLGAVAFARTYYVDNLPASVHSPEAAAAVIDTMLRYLIAALQTLLVAMVVFVIGAFLAGPSRIAVGFRRLVDRVLDAVARLLRRGGGWVAATSRALATAHDPLQIGLVLLAVVGLVLANRPGVAAVLWTTAAVLVLLAVLEVFARARPAAARPAAAGRPQAP